MNAAALILLASAFAGFAYAQAPHQGHQNAPAKSAAQVHSGTGVVKSIDTGKGSVVLAHEPIASLRWPAMTMKFLAKDKDLLGKLAPGKKIEFEFVQQDRDYVLTRVK